VRSESRPAADRVTPHSCVPATNASPPYLTLSGYAQWAGETLAVVFGPYDLSASMSLAGQTLVPEVLQAIDTVRQACTRANIPCGRFCMTATQTRQEIDKRARPIVVVSDLTLMAGVAKATMDSLNV
jgi:hypothetical protein